MNREFFYAVDGEGSTMPIEQFLDWENFQGMWTAGGEL